MANSVNSFREPSFHLFVIPGRYDGCIRGGLSRGRGVSEYGALIFISDVFV